MILIATLWLGFNVLLVAALWRARKPVLNNPQQGKSK